MRNRLQILVLRDPGSHTQLFQILAFSQKQSSPEVFGFPHGYRKCIIWLMISDPCSDFHLGSKHSAANRLPSSPHPLCNHLIDVQLSRSASPHTFLLLVFAIRCQITFIFHHLFCVLATVWCDYFCNHLPLGERILQRRKKEEENKCLPDEL